MSHVIAVLQLFFKFTFDKNNLGLHSSIKLSLEEIAYQSVGCSCVIFNSNNITI